MAGASFPTTHWSVVQRVAETESAGCEDALDHLCRVYWYPVYAELRRRGHSEPEAQDLTQEFFASMLRRSSFEAASPTKGRLRSYILCALGYFLDDCRDREYARKRGSGRRPISFEELDAEGWYRAEAGTSESPSEAFDRRWLLALLETALQTLETEQAAIGKAIAFRQLKSFLACEPDPGDYARIASALHLKTGAVAVAVHRLRQRYREIIRSEVRQTLLEPAELMDEMRHLFGR